jgi:hypothetical protein
VLASHADALAAELQIRHRQADALYCRGLLDHDAPRLLAAAKGYDEASRPLQRAKALEAAARELLDAADRGQARAAFTGAVEVYSCLGAAADVARLQATFRAHGIRRRPHAKARRVVDINTQLIAGASHDSVTVSPLDIDKRIPNLTVLRSGPCHRDRRDPVLHVRLV